jgi:Trypsin
LGGYDLINQKFGKSKKFPVAKVHIYEQYRRAGSQFFNDIALLELSTGVTFSDDILHICLPQKRLSLDGRTAFVTCTLFDT